MLKHVKAQTAMPVLSILNNPLKHFKVAKHFKADVAVDKHSLAIFVPHVDKL